MRTSPVPLRPLAFIAGLALASTAQAANWTLTLSDAELQVVATALQDQPYKVSAPLLNKIQSEIATQNLPAPKAVDPTPAAPEAKPADVPNP